LPKTHTSLTSYNEPLGTLQIVSSLDLQPFLIPFLTGPDKNLTIEQV
uniref:Uncharacterized protein n=1 Tax=Sinocyclocheilus anshuiensis TaxID=1608454 RepID=A0A671QLR4_9TELE